jgi:glycosyltransferase involved in cell wall biosynthesis
MDDTDDDGRKSKPKLSLGQKLVREIRRPFTRKFRKKLAKKYGPKHRVPELSAVPAGADEAAIRAIRDRVPCLAGVSAPVVLIIDDRCPEPDRDSGSVDAVNMITGLIQMGWHVVFATRTRRSQDPRYLAELCALGVRPVTAEDAPDLIHFIERYGALIDLFVLSRVGAGGVYLELIRHNCPTAKVVFNSVDLHYIREARAARLLGDPAALDAAERTRDREEVLVGRSDLTLVVSSIEEEILQASVPGCRTLVLPLARAIHPPRAGFAERSGIGFIGGFEHAPNIDAIRHFLADVWPLVHAADPSIRFEIVGSALPDGVLDGVPGDVRYLGTLDSIDGWLESLRMTVAPLRIGAGAKGKVASSLCAGLPCVLSAVAAEGMDLEDGRDVRVAIDPAAMAAAVVRLHSDAAEWAQLSAGGLAFARARLSVENYKQALRKGVVGMELPADALPV